MPDFTEETFAAQVSFLETASPAEPTVAPYGAGGATALAQREYRAVVARVSPLPNPAPAAAGTYFLTLDYDIAMADLAHKVKVAAAANTLRVGDLVRVGSITDAGGRVRGVYQIRVASLGTGTPDDVAGSLVNIVMKRVNPNQKNPAIP